jgi:uncharacterized protein (DUF952 family)
VYGNENTIYVDVVNEKAYTGYQNLPKTISFTDGAYCVDTNNAKLLTVVFMAGVTSTTASKTTFMIYDPNAYSLTTDANGDKIVVYKAFVKGAATTVTMLGDTANATITAAGVYTAATVDATTGYVSSLTQDAVFATAATKTTAFSGGVLVNGTTYVVTADTKYVQVTNNATTGVYKAEAVTSDYISADATTGSMTYVTVDPDATVANTAAIVYIYVVS